VSRQRLVVIGNGMAGARFVEELLARGGGERFQTTVLGEERHGNYNRILLSSVLAGHHDPADIVLNPESWYRDNEVTLRSGLAATGLDRAAGQVLLADGTAVPYDQLVLATGSVPFVPPLEGLNGPDGRWKRGVFVFRTLDDCARMTAHARDAKRAVVIGGGLLGLEAARGLLTLGPEVHVVHLMPHLMEVQLDPAAGAILARTMRRLGVTVHLERATTALLGDAAVAGLVFRDGTTLECDMLVVAAGIRPNVALARAAGLTVERGIVVGDDLASADDPKVAAIGECAQHRGRVYGLVAPVWEQATVLAERLSGRRPEARYAGSVVATKLKVMGVELAVMGDKEPASDDDEVVTYSEPSRGIYKKMVVRGGRLAGAIVLGDGAIAPSLQQSFDRATRLPERRADALFPGAGGAAARAASPADWPDDAQVCNCNGVSKGRLLEAMRNGCRTLDALRGATRATTGCGTCRPDVEALLDASGEAGPALARPSKDEARP
jgi:nitrite reductase (NADH) large subunit